ncbi:MAG TPA: cupin domain-containing protein [Prolixibacteraceae bacterium]|nr:cupin domain-containing protein [Prolixibacteraceae bacterium]
MNTILLKNYQETEGQPMGEGGNHFTVKPVIPRDEATKCRVNFVEVEPGNFAYGYHYHEMSEEVFYIISGTGIVKTLNGELTVKAGDAITFPTGKEGSHVIRNGSETEKLIYIDFGTVHPAEIVHLPNIGKVMVVGPYSNGMYDEK